MGRSFLLLLKTSPKQLCERAQSCIGEVRSKAGFGGSRKFILFRLYYTPPACLLMPRQDQDPNSWNLSGWDIPQQAAWAARVHFPAASPAPCRDAGWSLSLPGDGKRYGGEGAELTNSNRHYAFYLQVIGRGPAHVANNYIFFFTIQQGSKYMLMGAWPQACCQGGAVDQHGQLSRCCEL